MATRRNVRPELLSDTRPPPTVPCVHELSTHALAFWGVVSESFTLKRALDILSDTHGYERMRSQLRHAASRGLASLVTNGVLDGRTPFVPFDADLRCLDCGSIHEDSRLLRRSVAAGGPGCFRNLWGTVPLNTAGLRRSGRSVR